MNWLDPSEVEARLADQDSPLFCRTARDGIIDMGGALEQFVRAMAASDACCPAGPCDGLEWRAVARLLVKAMEEK